MSTTSRPARPPVVRTALAYTPKGGHANVGRGKARQANNRSGGAAGGSFNAWGRPRHNAGHEMTPTPVTRSGAEGEQKTMSTDTNSTTPMMPPLYKILRDGASCHGGDMTWPLATQNDDGTWTPGDWASVQGQLILCENALHLTDQPAAWYQSDAQCWRVEYRGETVGELDGGWQTKIGVREARLVARVEWDEVAVWSEGSHELRSGVGRAYDSATVEAYDSATVWAYDSATVEAYDSATVWAYDSATVRAYDSATVEAYDSATVRAYDSATVRAYGSATCISDRWHSSSAKVALNQMAAHVDRRGGNLVLRSAAMATDAAGAQS